MELTTHCRACGATGPVTVDCATRRASEQARGGAWLDTPPGGRWVERDEPNPFLARRELLWSHHRALASGMSDDDYVSAVGALDAAVAAVDGSGFRSTPLSSQPELAAAAGVGELWVKDETASVAGSHKARHLFGLALHLAVTEVSPHQRLAISSCGNAALGAATVAAAAQRPLDVYIPTWADPAVVEALDVRGATVHVCERRAGEDGDPCMARFAEGVTAGALAFGCQASVNLLTLDGGRTVGWELAQQLSAAGAAVDHVVVQVGGGALATSLMAGLAEAHHFGVLDHLPAVHVVQTEGCAPFDRAWRLLSALADTEGPDAALHDGAVRAAHYMWPWEDEPRSAASGILDDMTYDWLGVARGLFDTGGTSVVVSEATVIEANRLARAHTPVPVDTTGTAGLGGVLGLRSGPSPVIGADDVVAVLFTGRDRGVASA